MMKKYKNYQRPTAITVITAIGFLGLIPAVFVAFSSVAAGFGVWYQAYLLITVLIGAVIFWGFWTMQRWAPVTYAILAVVNQIILFIAGLWNLMALLLPLIVVAIGAYYYKDMRPGWSGPTTEDIPTLGDVKTTLGALLGLLLIIGLLIGSMFLYFHTTLKGDNTENSASSTVVSFSEIENKNIAKKLRQLTPKPSEFGSDFERSRERFAKTENGIVYSTTWKNAAAKKLKSYQNSSKNLQKPSRESMQKTMQDVQSFALSISFVGTSTDPFASMKKNYSQLPFMVRSVTEKNIADKRNLPSIGESDFSYRLDRPSGKIYMDHYYFYRDGYMVEFQIFISSRQNAFEELILPKARIIDKKIKNLEG